MNFSNSKKFIIIHNIRGNIICFMIFRVVYFNKKKLYDYM